MGRAYRVYREVSAVGRVCKGVQGGVGYREGVWGCMGGVCCGKGIVEYNMTEKNCFIGWKQASSHSLETLHLLL